MDGHVNDSLDVGDDLPDGGVVILRRLGNIKFNFDKMEQRAREVILHIFVDNCCGRAVRRNAFEHEMNDDQGMRVHLGLAAEGKDGLEGNGVL